MRQPILEGALAVFFLLFCALGGVAYAGQYHVYSCRTPDGEVAPVDGWSGSVAPGGAYDDYAINTCASGGALVAALGDETAHVAYVDRSTWSLEVPAFDRLAGATVLRAGYVHGAPNEEVAYEFWIAGPLPKNVLEECVFTEKCERLGNPLEPTSDANRVVVPSRALGTHLYVSASCGAGGETSECSGAFSDPANYAAVIYVYAADLTLEQTAGPSVSGVGGELASAAAVSGTSDLTFNASDPGAGVFEVRFSVDGQVVQTTVIDGEGGRCRNVGQTADGLPAFLYLQPCPASVSADVGFDTALAGNGLHHLVASVVDAAGNMAPVLDRTVRIANPGVPGPPNGTGASAQARLTARWQATPKARLTTAYGHEQTIHGRLTDPHGIPIGDAEIDVTTTPSYAGGRTAEMKAQHTSPNGDFTLHLPARTSSRAIHLAYRAHLGDPRPVAERTLTLAVKASLSLGIAPPTASVGSTIRFHGRLRGGPIPIGGKPLVLEARSGGGPWIEFDVIRSDGHGRYHATYTFKFPGPASYQFRVLCEAEADYPYATGSSPALDVQER